MKTQKEFDYDLFKDAEGKSFIRIKRTGEIAEVNDETFRLLRNEAMAMYRGQKGVPVYGKENGKSVVIAHTTILSINAIEEKMPDVVFSYDVDMDDLIGTETTQKEFIQSLTKKQCEVLENCLLARVSIRKYAKQNGVHKSSVDDTVRAIRKKFKKHFD